MRRHALSRSKRTSLSHEEDLFLITVGPSHVINHLVPLFLVVECHLLGKYTDAMVLSTAAGESSPTKTGGPGLIAVQATVAKTGLVMDLATDFTRGLVMDLGMDLVMGHLVVAPLRTVRHVMDLSSS